MKLRRKFLFWLLQGDGVRFVWLPKHGTRRRAAVNWAIKRLEAMA